MESSTHSESNLPADIQSLPEFQELEMCYNNAKTRIGDIHEHIDPLFAYATEVESIIECGVETAVSSWAFVKGLVENGKKKKRLISIDINYHPNIYHVGRIAKALGVDYVFKQGSDLHVEVEPVDITFIDTWHVDEQLRRELARFAPLTRRYIIMHDTVVDAELGETLRRRWNPVEQSHQSGYPIEGITRGLKYALADFLANNPEWRQRDHFTNCNGLTILERVPGKEKERLVAEITNTYRTYAAEMTEEYAKLIPEINVNGKLVEEVITGLTSMLLSDKYSLDELTMIAKVLSSKSWMDVSKKITEDAMSIIMSQVRTLIY